MTTPAIPAPPARLPRPDGLRVVTRENGRYCDLMPSASSWYLLPTLADFSLVRRDTRSMAGWLRFTGDAVEFEDIGGDELGTWRAVLAAMTAGVGLGGRVPRIPIEPYTGPGTTDTTGHVITDTATAPMATVAAAEAGASPGPVMGTTTPAERADTVLGSPAPDAPVAEIASRIAALSGLSDELLAELFKVERETFCRWRTGMLRNPRVGNRRRLGLLLALLEELDARHLKVRDWLLNSVTQGGLTPYQLLERGRIDQVAYLAATVGAPPTARDARVSTKADPEPLEFGEDDVWDLEPLDDDEP